MANLSEKETREQYVDPLLEKKGGKKSTLKKKLTLSSLTLKPESMSP